MTTGQIAWPGLAGDEVACAEKRRLLDENLAELDQVMQDMFEDAILMGVDEAALRGILIDRIARLRSPRRDPMQPPMPR